VPKQLLKKIRTIPDFPKPGILFYDVTTLFQDGEGLKRAVDQLTERCDRYQPDTIVAIDARGFLLGSAIAYQLDIGVVLARKKGKLPYKTISTEYALEYGTAEIEMHTDAFAETKRAVVVDDLLATGGTATAAIDLVERAGGHVAACAFVIEIAGLGGRGKLGDVPVETLLDVSEG